jgi:simple sugar transport system ATP-binding protein
MSVSENCAAGYLRDGRLSRFGLMRYGVRNKVRDDYIEKSDIRVGDRDGQVGQLSGGNAQKIIIAREFENKPRLLIASRPTRGVDIGSIEFIHKALLKLRGEGAAILLVSSELSEVISLSDRVAVMYKGEIIGEVSPRDTTAELMGLLMAGAKPNESEALI